MVDLKQFIFIYNLLRNLHQSWNLQQSIFLFQFVQNKKTCVIPCGFFSNNFSFKKIENNFIDVRPQRLSTLQEINANT